MFIFGKDNYYLELQDHGMAKQHEVNKALIWVGVIGLVALAVYISQALLVIFASLVFASLIDGGARLIGRYLAIPRVLRIVMVLLGAIATSRFHRIREGVLLKTLGASKKQIGQILFTEYVTLGTIAGFAGILLAPIAFVHVNMGFIGLKAFPAAVLGGFGSIPGAIAGGLIIGVVEALAGFYLPEGFKDVAAYVVLLAVLIGNPYQQTWYSRWNPRR